MSASKCVDTYVISLIADLDCHLAIIGQAGDDGDMKEFILSDGNEQSIVFDFEYYVGIGANPSHADYGFSNTIDALNAGNASQMSISAGLFNPPSPDQTGAANAIKNGTLSFSLTAGDDLTFGANGANSQNLGGEIILNTGVTP